ncbi:hypothetical protein GCM10011519_29820 [Marmoricola endophyticus]|uniref:DUF1295 domain-containing protein n=1 Tax=Marmoricola endophyticus TaxID=2040280 RepID=A0A917BQM7_9ACTN|nr:DUF1295 domain-containing protein [Marmoricola endophyticus]GGF53958.1 hypothetical protein GCM10011519_29820 [Marmoricola endophyticus]
MTWVVVLVSALAVVVMMAATAAWARSSDRWAVVDTTWGLGFGVIAVLAALVGDGDVLRRVLLLALPAIWAGRLASHIIGRAKGQGEDPRYQKLRDEGNGLVRRVLLPQGVAMFVVSLPIQIGVGSDRDVTWLAWAGVVVWAVGLAFETVGDRQLAAFKADPDNKGKVMDKGLWGWTRHPNYFGDATMWWGVWIVAADSGWAGVATIVGPLAMTYFIRNVTGAKLLEQTMSRREGWDDYARRTNLFFPMPPRRG